ncbi:MAG TPA: SDR family oxidoreductase [Rhizomicrobium sp.]|nr:SDR family oxidoreductase [Rhizomicrobium sp.]
MSLNSKRIVIIGGSSGIGFAIAENAESEGANVVVASSNPAKVEAAVKSLSGRATGFTIDVTSEASVETVFSKIGRFDHLVTTAGDWKAKRGPVPDMDLDAAKWNFAVRFWGALAAVKHAHKFIDPNGSITLTDGMVAHRPSKGSAVATAMAGAVEHLTRGLAVDLAPVRVNCVCPGLIRTGVWESIPEDRRAEQFERMTKRQPLSRVGEPSEAAEAYLYLMRGGYTTGQVLHVDGGLSVV